MPPCGTRRVKSEMTREMSPCQGLRPRGRNWLSSSSQEVLPSPARQLETEERWRPAFLHLTSEDKMRM